MEYLSKERYNELADELKHLINEVCLMMRVLGLYMSSATDFDTEEELNRV